MKIVNKYFLKDICELDKLGSENLVSHVIITLMTLIYLINKNVSISCSSRD